MDDRWVGKMEAVLRDGYIRDGNWDIRKFARTAAQEQRGRDISRVINSAD